MHHYDLDPTGYLSATSETLITSTLGWVYKLGEEVKKKECLVRERVNSFLFVHSPRKKATKIPGGICF